jgi:hypothetical protein
MQIIKIKKDSILTDLKELFENTGFMLGVNKGFHESPLPSFAVKSYSDLDTLKKQHRKDDLPIAQDLGLRMGTQFLTKATVGGLVYGGSRLAQEQFLGDNPEIDLDSDSSKLAAGIPAIASAWYTSDRLNKYLPSIHKKLFNKNSIYQ